MVVPSSKRRKPPKAKSTTRWDVVCMIAFAVFGVVYRLDDAVTRSHFTVQEEHQQNIPNIQEQCRDSCRATLSKNGYRIPDPVSFTSASLSSSAVSAMFNLRDVDEYSNNSLNVKNVHHVDHLERVPKLHRDVFNDGDELLKTFKSRPSRLPPLIDALVGTLDSDFEAIHSSHNWHGQRKLIRRMDKDDKERFGEITKKGLRDMSLGEDPVAMVAAAAAAALWSEHKERGSSPLRMQVVNDEWEEALRWISSWGGQHDQSNIESTHHETKTDIEKDNEGVQKKNRRKRNINDNRPSSNRLKAENEIDFNRFYEVCIDRCIGDGGANRSRGQKTGDSFDVMTYNLNVRSTLGVNQLLSLVMSKIEELRSISSVWRSRAYVKAAWGLLGIMLSTVGVWLRNLIDRRKQTNCYQSLLEEEARLASTSTPSSRNRNSGSKKIGSKRKSRRKRRDNRSNHKHHQSNQSTSFDEASDTSDASFDRSYIEEDFVKPSGDQGSKEGNTTVSTCTTDGIGYEDQLDSFHPPTPQPLSMRSRVKSSKYQQRNAGSSTIYSPRGKSTGRDYNFHSSKSKSLRLGQDDISSNKGKRYSVQGPVLVPTSEQREEAARKLIAFQQSQVQKMLNCRGWRKHEVEITGSSAILSENFRSCSKDLNTNEAKLVHPPPGLTTLTKNEDHKNCNEQVKEQNDASLLVSNLLDEDDEMQTAHYNSGLSIEKNNSLQNGEFQPVPFGDLLVGYASNVTSTFNPWREELVDSSTVITQVSTPSHTSMHNANSLTRISSDLLSSKDANFCLQVSAQAFSPSVKSHVSGGEFEEKTKIW